MKTTNVIIPGQYPLEGLLAEPDSSYGKPCGAALICHPHPLYQGTMHNKVVTSLARAVAQCGYLSLRFNFRGVGNSGGEYGQGIGELADAHAASQYLQQLPQVSRALPLIILGFSFGGYIAAALASQIQPAPQALITVAPALQYDELQVTEIPQCPWLVIHGDADDVIDYQLNKAWIIKHAPHTKWVQAIATGHFFHGKLVVLKQMVTDFITQLPA